VNGSNGLRAIGGTLLACCATLAWAKDHTGGACTQSAATLSTACALNAGEEYQVALAACTNVSDANGRAQCQADAAAARDDARQTCGDVTDARGEVCAALGDAAYEPAFGAAYADQFVDPREIGGSVTPNPYFPLVAGSQWKYKSTYQNEDGETVTERDTTTVTSDTKLIDGVTCVIVTDVVRSTDGTIESTQDWFAQDVAGNVWYCGEISQQKEKFDGDDPAKPELVAIDGSWKTGRDSAKPGIQMFAAPIVGKTYRQELLWTEAEDVATILDLHADESVAGGAYRCNGQCLETRDYSALEPDANEHKFYLPNVGLMLEIDLTNGARNELISYTQP
jgi:hypothetical protein